MQRRTLRFHSFDEVLADVEKLSTAGYEQLGNWDLAQICNHLSHSMLGSVKGFEMKLPWLVRRTVGPFFLNQMIKSGRMRDGHALPKKLVPKKGQDEKEAVANFKSALKLFLDHPGPYQEHAVFGNQPREKIQAINLIHASHHLEFLVPKGT